MKKSSLLKFIGLSGYCLLVLSLFAIRVEDSDLTAQAERQEQTGKLDVRDYDQKEDGLPKRDLYMSQNQLANSNLDD